MMFRILIEFHLDAVEGFFDMVFFSYRYSFLEYLVLYVLVKELF